MTQTLSKAYKPGTGQSLCRTPKDTQLRLTNTPLDADEAAFILWYLARETDSPEIKAWSITLSDRQTKDRWGTAWPCANRIILYRHDVGTFLHEIAHLWVGCNEGHGPLFAEALDLLIAIYLQPRFAETKAAVNALMKGTKT